MNSFTQITKAAKSLVDKFSHNSWWRGCGIYKGKNGKLYLTVRVEPGTINHNVPDVIDGFPIKIEFKPIAKPLENNVENKQECLFKKLLEEENKKPAHLRKKVFHLSCPCDNCNPYKL